MKPTVSRKYISDVDGRLRIEELDDPARRPRTISTSEFVKYEAIWVGNSRMLIAKMIGMTPAWLTRSGRNVWPPWYIRRPRTRLAYWMGIRRWPSWM